MDLFQCVWHYDRKISYIQYLTTAIPYKPSARPKNWQIDCQPPLTRSRSCCSSVSPPGGGGEGAPLLIAPNEYHFRDQKIISLHDNFHFHTQNIWEIEPDDYDFVTFGADHEGHNGKQELARSCFMFYTQNYGRQRIFFFKTWTILREKIENFENQRQIETLQNYILWTIFLTKQ